MVEVVVITARGPRLNQVTSLGNRTGRYGREQEWAGQGFEGRSGWGMDMEEIVWVDR